MSASKILGLLGGALAINELTKASADRSASVNDASVNRNIVDLLVQRIKTDAHLQSILKGPAGPAGSGGGATAATLEILSQGLRMTAAPDTEYYVGDHLFYVLIGETAGGATDGTDIVVKVDISEFYLKDIEGLVIAGASFIDQPVLTNDRNPDGTAYDGDPMTNFIPQDRHDWSFEGRTGDILAYKLGGVRERNGFGPFMRSAFACRMYLPGFQVFPDEEYAIGIEVSGGGLTEPLSSSIVVPPAFYVPLE